MIILLFIQSFSLFYQVYSCSNILISSGASQDSSTIIAYNADSATLYGSLYHYPSTDFPPLSMRDIYDWDTGKYLGQIKEVQHTFNVVGNTNEYGLIIGETTFGGLEILLSQSKAKIDYGSLIWITLQRSKSAREAIFTIGNLLKEYGYASEGESFSIADSKEVWIMEIIGKGEYELGAVWVAVRIPDGYVSSHANQARIRNFPLNDPENCVYSDDVISFAKRIGLYPTEAPDSEFSFSDIYDPVTFGGARFCEARVWSFFGAIMGKEWADQYLDYAQGYNLTNRMPLYVKPSSKISVSDTMQYMRNHYEDTSLDMSGKQISDVGAYTHSPYRSHPLTWQSTVKPDGSDGEKPLDYFQERPIATPQTGWNFIAQSRRWMPRELSSILWFGVDDSSTTVHFPIYGSATKIPESFAGQGTQDGVTPPMMTFNLKSAFYAFNLVANWAYSRWDLIYPDVYDEVIKRESNFFSEISALDSHALNLYSKGLTAEAIDYVTNYSLRAGNKLVEEWVNFFGQLFVKYRDGYVITKDTNSRACGCGTKDAFYPQDWYDRVVKDTSAHYLYDPHHSEGELRLKAQFRPKSKLDLLSSR